MEQMVQTDRKLPAIMFTDMVSFTEAVEQNEAQALQRIDTHNKVLRAEFQKFKRKEIKSTSYWFPYYYLNNAHSQLD